MSVSLVKRYFAAGFNTPGCLPESPAALFVTLEDARAYLADELERAANELFELELENALADYRTEDDYNADWSAAHSDSASMDGSAGLVRRDPDGDVAWRANRGGWSTIEPDGYAYFIAPAVL